jgi:hypothetical protein
MSPLRDVAGLLRSLDYAAVTVANRKSAGTASVASDQRDALLARFRTVTPSAFLNAYRTTLDSRGAAFNEKLLDLFMIEKSAYEIRYEAANRPSWLPIPLGSACRDPAAGGKSSTATRKSMAAPISAMGASSWPSRSRCMASRNRCRFCCRRSRCSSFESET